LLQEGQIKCRGETEHVLKEYHSTTSSYNEDASPINKVHIGSGELKFLDTWIEDNGGNKITTIRTGQEFNIVAEFLLNKQKIINPKISFGIKDSAGNYLTDLWNQVAGYSWKSINKSGRVICKIPKCPFNEGIYFYSLHCSSDNITLDQVNDAGNFIVEKGDYFGTGKLPLPRYAKFMSDQEWDLQIKE